MPSYMSAAAVSGAALQGGAVAVHRVQVQGRPAQVAQVPDDHRRLQGPEVVHGDVGDGVLPVGVGRDVVVDKLAPVGVHGRDGGVPGRLELLAAGWCRLGQGLTQPLEGRRDGGGVAGQVLAWELRRQVVEEVVEGRRDLGQLLRLEVRLGDDRPQQRDTVQTVGGRLGIGRVVGQDLAAVAEIAQDTSGRALLAGHRLPPRLTSNWAGQYLQSPPSA
jgi:hypothetical protein